MKRRILADLFEAGEADAVLNEVLGVMASAVPGLEASHIVRCYRILQSLYEGRFAGYRACNTAYHDLRHAADTFLAMARLVHGAVLNSETITERQALMALTAAGLHDAGYIQETRDLQGTGAKFKIGHEQRSIRWLARHAADVGLAGSEADSIGQLIRCTEISVSIAKVPFPDKRTELLGRMLAAADLLAQLSDQVYLEKLTLLYEEDRESGRPTYDSATDALIKALGFYEMFKKRLSRMLPLHERLLQSHFRERWGIDRNLYREAIALNHTYLSAALSASGSSVLGRLRRRGTLQTLCGTDPTVANIEKAPHAAAARQRPGRPRR
jgi:hypothetical protein